MASFFDPVTNTNIPSVCLRCCGDDTTIITVSTWECISDECVRQERMDDYHDAAVEYPLSNGRAASACICGCEYTLK